MVCDDTPDPHARAWRSGTIHGDENTACRAVSQPLAILEAVPVPPRAGVLLPGGSSATWDSAPLYERATTAQQPDDEEHDGDDHQHMKERADGVGPNDPEQLRDQ